MTASRPFPGAPRSLNAIMREAYIRSSGGGSLREKNRKINETPCHHKLETYLDAYIEAPGIEGDGKGSNNPCRHG
jgi:hypothetical protein